MKKLILCFVFAAITAANAQAQTPQTDNTKSGEMSKMDAPDLPPADVNGLSKDLMSALTPKLALSDEQTPKVANLVATFLKAKTAILPLLEKNPKAYSDKFGVIQGDLMGGLKGVLTPQQMTGFVGLMPKVNDETNVMSHLFF